ASAQGADAYTNGTDIYFGAGSYQPLQADGRRLIAHELAHVVQQSPVPRGAGTTASSSAVAPDAAEAEADRAAAAVLDQRTPDVATRLSGAPLVQRQPKGGGGAVTAPASMSIANVGGAPTPADCGAFLWKVNFNLPSASPAGGYFVQEVQATRSPTDCKGAATAAGKIAYHFWEAWHVKPGGTEDELVADGTFTFADQFSLPSVGIDSKGSF